MNHVRIDEIIRELDDTIKPTKEIQVKPNITISRELPENLSVIRPENEIREPLRKLKV